MSKPIVIRRVAAGSEVDPQPLAGPYLAAYDLDAQDLDVHAVATWTEDRAEALVFPTFEAAYNAWQQQRPARPVRGDGRPNRPLTLFSVMFENAEKPQ